MRDRDRWTDGQRDRECVKMMLMCVMRRESVCVCVKLLPMCVKLLPMCVMRMYA
jgi:hypothetical protein